MVEPGSTTVSDLGIVPVLMASVLPTLVGVVFVAVLGVLGVRGRLAAVIVLGVPSSLSRVR